MIRFRNIATFLVLFSLIGTLSRADTATTGDGRVIENPTSNGDLKMRVNVGGTKTDAIAITGSSGAVAIVPNASISATQFNIGTSSTNNNGFDAMSINVANTGGSRADIVGTRGGSKDWQIGSANGALGAIAQGNFGIISNGGSTVFSQDNSTTAHGTISNTGGWTVGNAATVGPLLQVGSTTTTATATDALQITVGTSGDTRASIRGKLGANTQWIIGTFNTSVALTGATAANDFYIYGNNFPIDFSANGTALQGKLQTSGAWTLGTVSGGVSTGTTLGFDASYGSGTTHVMPVLYGVSLSTTNTCTAICLANRAAEGNCSTISGACIFAWDSSNTPSTCGTNQANPRCLCSCIRTAN